MDIEGRLAALRKEFPGWTIEASTMPFSPYRAVRDGDDKAAILGAGSYGALRRLLHEADEVVCAQALLALRTALAKRGAEALLHGVSVVTRSRTRVQRTIGARRGRFTWHDGTDLGPISDVDAVADEILQQLELKR
ncbi:hypothetical protein [Actinomadura sp. WMMA1423]|uniref:hypothetical protein n=1 Tax=Actinomadura sp. WMMA1423 TaxID=2591108 RepID=UPI001146A103|nr:hypothetical protein [Actinomadura sp. WMMA1423]